MWNERGPQPLQLSEFEAMFSIYGLEEVATKIKYTRLLKLMDPIELTHLRIQQERANK